MKTFVVALVALTGLAFISTFALGYLAIATGSNVAENAAYLTALLTCCLFVCTFVASEVS